MNAWAESFALPLREGRAIAVFTSLRAHRHDAASDLAMGGRENAARAAPRSRKSKRKLTTFRRAPRWDDHRIVRGGGGEALAPTQVSVFAPSVGGLIAVYIGCSVRSPSTGRIDLEARGWRRDVVHWTVARAAVRAISAPRRSGRTRR